MLSVIPIKLMAASLGIVLVLLGVQTWRVKGLVKDNAELSAMYHQAVVDNNKLAEAMESSKRASEKQLYSASEELKRAQNLNAIMCQLPEPGEEAPPAPALTRKQNESLTVYWNDVFKPFAKKVAQK